MSLVDGGLAAILGAALGGLFQSGTLNKITRTETGTGGFAVATTPYTIRVSADALGAADRAASGIPASAIRLTVLRGGLPVAIELDDEIVLNGATFRVIRVDSDPASASYLLVAVPG